MSIDLMTRERKNKVILTPIFDSLVVWAGDLNLAGTIVTIYDGHVVIDGGVNNYLTINQLNCQGMITLTGKADNSTYQVFLRAKYCSKNKTWRFEEPNFNPLNETIISIIKETVNE